MKLSLSCALLFLFIVSANADEWTLESALIGETMRPFLGNGYFGAVITGEGTGWGDANAPAHYMTGLYNGANSAEYLAKIPAWSPVGFNNGSAWFNKSTGTVSGYLQKLNMKEGSIATQFTWINSGKTCAVDILVFISRSDPHLAVIKYSVTPQWSGRVSFNAPHFAGYGFGHLTQVQKDRDSAQTMIWLSTRTTNTNITIAQVGATLFENFTPACSYADWNLDKQITQTAQFDAVSGQTYTLYDFIAVFTSKESADPLADAKSKVLSARSAGYTAALGAHVTAMNDFWKTDIVIAGLNTAQVQQVVRSWLFYLHQNIRDGSAGSIPPMGLYLDAWSGHIFWDAEIWMYPSVLITSPKAARSMLDYRYGTLAGAQANATGEGFQGAEIAWESGYSGMECAPSPYRSEEHISGDVPFALWKYYLLSRDTTWLSTYGYPLILNTAQFWASRAVRRNNRYEILGVMPPDEDAGIVDNCVYTNAIAAATLTIAGKVCDILQKQKDPKWKAVADSLWLPFDSVNQRYLEFGTYGGSSIKQASTELLIYPLEQPMTAAVKANILDYYSTKLPADCIAMSKSLYTIIAAELGRRDQAYSYFTGSYTNNIKGPFYIFSESPANNNVCFMTGIGGCLQSILYGFTGMRIHENGVMLNPLLPSQWTQLTFSNITIGSASYDIVIHSGDSATVTRVSGSSNVDIVDKNGKSFLKGLSAVRSQGGVKPASAAATATFTFKAIGAKVLLPQGFGNGPVILRVYDVSGRLLDITRYDCLRGRSPALNLEKLTGRTATGVFIIRIDDLR